MARVRFSAVNSVLIALLFIIWILLGIARPDILSWTNLYSLIVLSVETGLLALGQALVIIGGGGGIELSVGAIFAVSSVILGVMTLHGWPWLASVLISLAAGALMGVLNGFLIWKVRIPPLITTLATMFAYYGIALLLSGGVDISSVPKEVQALGQGSFLGLPVQFVAIYLPVFIIMILVEKYSAFSRALFLSGTNELGAILSGINVWRTRFFTYVVMGLLAGLAAMIDAGRLTVTRPDAASEANLLSITIAVLGGVNIFGGEGSMASVGLATLVIGSISYGLSYVNANPVYEQGVIGLVLIISIVGQQVLGWLARRAGQRSLEAE